MEKVGAQFTLPDHLRRKHAVDDDILVYSTDRTIFLDYYTRGYFQGIAETVK